MSNAMKFPPVPIILNRIITVNRLSSCLSYFCFLTIFFLFFVFRKPETSLLCFHHYQHPLTICFCKNVIRCERPAFFFFCFLFIHHFFHPVSRPAMEKYSIEFKSWMDFYPKMYLNVLNTLEFWILNTRWDKKKLEKKMFLLINAKKSTN